ncbi:hypothetical protein ESA94_15455 [Lacibacter luteus]|uniref:C1q domain-containing protein n=1 Tax=Lacibacter luteus TaxID=2508719 RepID=A0A4Q1CG99_9BACT|nr:hypothetical protein [Lacibacter luteus]RXK58785.1 hypothetical protein ESA94_15455 [Lacibacter luteus]
MKQLFSSIFLLLFTATVWAQAPQLINYQGVARNASGVAYASQQVSVRLNIRTGSPDGAIEYSETRTVTTNQFGLFNIQIGSSGMQAVSGFFSTISWGAGTKFLQTEISVNGQPFANLGATQMLSVPYALHSREAKDLIFPFTKTGTNTTDLFSIANNDNTATSSAIKANATAGRAIFGNSNTGTGGYFVSSSGMGVFGYAPNGTGVTGMTNSASDIGISAINNGDGVALSVKGGLRIFDGNTNPGTGKVLTSDANGNATWQAPATTAPVAFFATGAAQGGLQNIPNNVEYKIHPAVQDYDGSNNFTLYNQTPSSTFTAPTTGVYRFNIEVTIDSYHFDVNIKYGYMRLYVKSNGVETQSGNDGVWEPGFGTISLKIDEVLFLKAGDQVWAETLTNTEDGSNPILKKCKFAGYLIK